VRGILDLDARLMRKPLTSLKVCSDVKSLQFKKWIYNVFPRDYWFLFSLLTGLPGVLFVLPDSYVDPEYKDYGGKTLHFLIRAQLFFFSFGVG
jgi:hypothetical protein